jgi:hypothetical protein
MVDNNNFLNFLYILFFTQAGTDASHPEICFNIHSHTSWPCSGDCEGSRIQTRDCYVLSLVSPSCLNQLSYHIPLTELPHPPNELPIFNACLGLPTHRTNCLKILEFTKISPPKLTPPTVYRYTMASYFRLPYFSALLEKIHGKKII